MDYFVDANILLRALTPEAPQAPAARSAIRSLRRAKKGLVIFPQTVMEFWSVCTRPKPPQGNGLGFDAALAERYSRFIEGFLHSPSRPRRRSRRVATPCRLLPGGR